jgi:hypothetical protein
VNLEAVHRANNFLTQFDDFSTMTELFDNDSQSKGRSTKKSKGGGRNTFTRGGMIPETVLLLSSSSKN